MHNISFLQNENLPSFAQFCISDSRYEDLHTHFTQKTYRAGECVQSEGDTITHFGIVVSGILKAVSYSRDGEELCNAYFEEEDVFPEFLYLTGNRHYTYLLYVEKRAEVLWIPIFLLEEMLSADAGLVSALLCYVSQRGLKNQLYLNCLNYQTVRERIAYWIMGVRKIEARQEQEVHMPRSQRIFANMLHVNRSSLNQELKQMEREGYFRLDKERLLHVEGERLKELL